MSTMSTQLNLGASYLVNDFWVRFIRPDATDAEQVRAGRLATVVSLMLGSGLGLLLTDAGQAFNLLLLIGAGTGAVHPALVLVADQCGPSWWRWAVRWSWRGISPSHDG